MCNIVTIKNKSILLTNTMFQVKSHLVFSAITSCMCTCNLIMPATYA